MANLTRQSVQECIMTAYGRYVTSTTGDVVCNTTDNGNVTIQCVINNDRFNSGFAGNQMAANEIDNLRVWCRTHPGMDQGVNWVFGFRGLDHNHPDSINITLINRTHLMFNFHVYVN